MSVTPLNPDREIVKLIVKLKKKPKQRLQMLFLVYTEWYKYDPPQFKFSN